MSTEAISSENYTAWLGEMKSRIQAARIAAARSVNREIILLYWDIGRGIVEKQKAAGWGDAVVERLSADLRAEFPDLRGFSANSIWLMRQLYAEFSTPEFLEQAVQELKRAPGQAILEQTVPESAGSQETLILKQPVPEILTQAVREFVSLVPRGHHVELMKKVKEPAARFYYLRATARCGWSRSVLLNQIKAGAYKRAISTPTSTAIRLRPRATAGQAGNSASSHGRIRSRLRTHETHAGNP
jgi:predicted nuclease of restriction endonuclease-like (RecB) superfamily